jgi:hypothetical protein
MACTARSGDMNWILKVVEQNSILAASLILLLFTLVTWLVKDLIGARRQRIEKIEDRVNALEDRVGKVEALEPLFCGLKETLDVHAAATTNLSKSVTEVSRSVSEVVFFVRRATQDLDRLENEREAHGLKLQEHDLRLARMER